MDVLSGQPAAALDRLARCTVEHLRLGAVALVEHALGHPRKSQRALDALVGRFGHVRAYHIAIVQARRGANDLAFQWLERAVAERQSDVDMLKIEPMLHSLHGDPRYAALLGKMNLPAE